MTRKKSPKINSITTAELEIICAEDTLTLTPNKRTCSNLTDRAVQFKMQEKKACKVPKIFDLDRWVRDRFSDLRMANIMPFSRSAIISEGAYAGYWIKEFCFDKTVCESLNVTDYLPSMMKADKIASRWKFGCDYICDTPLSSRYMYWRKNVYQQLKQSGFVTINQAIEMVIDAIYAGKLHVPKNVAIYSFDEIPPLYQDLFTAISEKAEFLRIEIQHDKKALWQKVQTQNKGEQYETVARWAYEFQMDNPAKRIAIVVPDMEANKNRIIRALDDLFKPQWSLDLQSYKLAYDVSLGDKLTSLSFINDALFTLSINQASENTESIARLFRIPSIKHFNIERFARLRYANKIVTSGTLEAPLSTIYMHQECPLQIRKRLANFEDILTSAPVEQLPSEWSRTFSEALDSLGWLRDAGSSEKISNGIDGLNECFDKLAGLDLHVGMIGRNVAHNILASYCEYHTVNASVGDTPISILGTLEAAGLEYDAFWVVDCNADVFPSMVSLNDCLPLKLQADLEAPHSSVQREFDYTNRLFDRYKSSCSNLYTSFVLENEKSVKMKPAYVLDSIEEIPSISSLICEDVTTRKELHYQRFSVVRTTDLEPAPVKLTGDNQKVIKGGTSVIDSIQHCSMGAYIKHELGFKQISSNSSIGYTAVERGDVLHEALEYFWGSVIKLTEARGNLTDHETLISLTDQEMELLVDEGIETGFFWVARDDVPPMLKGSEKQLLKRTLIEWLETEKERAPFNVVAIEMTKTIQLGDYSVKVRLDRVDDVILGNSNIAIAIDYKSGENDINQAMASKFKSQLPLASLPSTSTNMTGKTRPVFTGEIGAVGYANVRLNGSALSGIGRDDSLLDFGVSDANNHRSRSAPKGWTELQTHWKEKMVDSIKNYAEGRLTYTPSKKACEFCPNKNFCEYSV
jgi:ATP-dependent helicase/nuclease subunit B